MVKRILVTGGEGFIGSHLLRALVAQGHTVSSYGIAGGALSGVDYMLGDICDPIGLRKAVASAKPDIVFHLAGVIDGSYEDQYRVNVSGTQNLLDAFSGRVIFVSTSLVYHNCAIPFREDMLVSPVDPYPSTKLHAENLCLARRGTVVRLSVVYGPYQKNAMFISSLARYLENRQGSFVMTRGEQQRDFVYIDDVTRACLLLLDKEYVGVLNIGLGKAYTLHMVLDLAKQICGEFPVEQTIPYRNGELMQHLFDISKAREVLGWEPHVDLPEGLRYTFLDILHRV